MPSMENPRVQGRPHAVPDQEQVVEVREIFRIARNRYTDHQPEIPEQIASARAAATIGCRRGSTRPGVAPWCGGCCCAARHGPGAQTPEHHRPADAVRRSARAGHGCRDWRRDGTGCRCPAARRHRVRSARASSPRRRRTGPHFQAEAERIAIDEDLAVFEPGTIRQPLREGRRIIAGKGGCSLRARQEVRCLGSPASMASRSAIRVRNMIQCSVETGSGAG
jgi:hypothetical protein